MGHQAVYAYSFSNLKFTFTFTVNLRNCLPCSVSLQLGNCRNGYLSEIGQSSASALPTYALRSPVGDDINRYKLICLLYNPRLHVIGLNASRE